MVQPQTIVNLLLKYEQQIDLVDRTALYRSVERSIETGTLNFAFFSCLAAKRGKEELILDFSKTLFFDGGAKGVSSRVKCTARMVQEIKDHGLQVKVLPILADSEPKRTWGWHVPQDELTLACELMIDEASRSGILPDPDWKPVTWSELESRSGGTWTFERSLAWARSPGKHIISVRQQTACLAGFVDRYHFPLGLEETSVRQVAAYALEGAVLQEILPNAILLQSEIPLSEKDGLYQWLRDKKLPLCIIHPFD